MSIYDTLNEFSGDHCAKLIAGANDTTANQDAYQVAIGELRGAYQTALDYYNHLTTFDDGEGWLTRPPLQADAIQSADMQRCERILQIDPKGGAFTGWLTHSPTVFESQSFERDEVIRWLSVKGFNSVYLFANDAPAHIPAPVVAAGKTWTPEKLEQLKAYRETHTMPETADKFGISEQRIRRLLPSKRPTAKPFAGLINRMK